MSPPSPHCRQAHVNTSARHILLRALWLIIPLSILLGDAIFVWRGMLPSRVDAPGALLLSVLLSLGFWWALTQLASKFTWLAKAVALLLPLHGLLLGSAWLMAGVTAFPNVTTLLYIVQEPLSAWLMASSKSASPLPWLMAVVGVLWGFAFYQSAKNQKEHDRLATIIHGTSSLLVLLAITQMPEAEPFRQAPYQADVRLANTAALTAGRLLFEQTELPMVTRRDAPHLPKDASTPRYDVLIFLTESLRPDHLPMYGYTHRDTAPTMARFVAEHDASTIVYERAYSNSAYTVFSLISILTGLSIVRDVETLARAPLLWHYAHALGVETFFISAQELRWSNVFDFLFVYDPPHTLQSATDAHHPLVNDLGIDDAFTAADAVRAIEKLPPDRPFLGVVQTNATHFPFLAAPDTPWPLPVHDVEARYDAAVRLTDQVFARLITALEKSGRLDRTFIFILSDHAEHIYREQDATLQANQQNRLRPCSCHPTITHIPFVLHIPEAFTRSRTTDASFTPKDNATRVTSTLDILPTILDLWQIPSSLDGQSLLAPIATERIATCLSPISSFPGQYLGFATYGGEDVFYHRRDFAFTERLDPGVETTFTDWQQGQALDSSARERFEAHMAQTPELAPLREQVSRWREGN